MKTLLLLLALLGAAQVADAQARRTPRPTPPPAAPPAPAAPRPANPPPPRQQAVIGVDETGTFEGRTYANSALGFSLTLPAGWEAQDSDVQKEVLNRSADKVNEMVTTRGSKFDDSINRTKMLLIAVKPTDAAFSPSVTVMVEDIRAAIHVRTPKQYVEQMRKLLSLNPNLPIKFVGEPIASSVAGADFSSIEAGPSDPQATVIFGQQYMVTLRKNRALVFILTYDGSPGQMKECQAVIEALRFQ